MGWEVSPGRSYRDYRNLGWSVLSEPTALTACAFFFLESQVGNGIWFANGYSVRVSRSGGEGPSLPPCPSAPCPRNRSRHLWEGARCAGAPEECEGSCCYSTAVRGRLFCGTKCWKAPPCCCFPFVSLAVESLSAPHPQSCVLCKAQSNRRCASKMRQQLCWRGRAVSPGLRDPRDRQLQDRTTSQGPLPPTPAGLPSPEAQLRDATGAHFLPWGHGKERHIPTDPEAGSAPLEGAALYPHWQPMDRLRDPGGTSQPRGGAHRASGTMHLNTPPLGPWDCQAPRDSSLCSGSCQGRPIQTRVAQPTLRETRNILSSEYQHFLTLQRQARCHRCSSDWASCSLSAKSGALQVRSGAQGPGAERGLPPGGKECPPGQPPLVPAKSEFKD